MRTAILSPEAYKNSLRNRPASEQTKYNLEFARHKQQQDHPVQVLSCCTEYISTAAAWGTACTYPVEKPDKSNIALTSFSRSFFIALILKMCFMTIHL